MIAEIGLFLLWLAAGFSLLTLVAGGAHLMRGLPPFAALVRPLTIVQAVLVALSFALLIALFVRTDLSVALVARNSHADKPLIFKVAGAWGNHEGSMLLWLTVLSLSGALVAWLERRLSDRTLIATLVAQAALALGFFAFLLFASNPFARLDPAPPQGAGLNPLLQDIGLAFHPPTLYIGYVGLSVAFSFAVGALLTRDVGPAFARAMRPWVLLSWIFLTIGITAGSYWAYYELGWGGWWFWDPVENVSLIPWLAATALLHSVSVTATRDALRAWTVMLAVVAFSMSMVGTFIVRSGLLTSVHSFAVDPERGAFLLALMAIYIGGALTLFGLRIATVSEGKRFALVSREGALVINNLLLAVLLSIVLVGTLYPIVAEAMGDKVSVGPPWFNATTAPVALPLFVLIAVGPLLRWRRDDGERVLQRMLPAIGAGIAALVVVLVGAGSVPLLPLAGFAVAALVLVGSVLPLWGRSLRRVPMVTWGMVVAHAGVAVSLAGMAADSAFTTERLAAMRVGEGTRVGAWQVRLDAVRPVAGPNWTAVEGRMTARRGDAVYAVAPQSRRFASPPTDTNEAALLTVWDGQLYAVLGARVDEPGAAPGAPARWQVRLWWKPFVWAIWAGGGLIALGGALALIGRAQVWAWWRARRRAAANRRFA